MRETPLVLVANRLPWRAQAGRWWPAPGGLISALHPIAHRHRTTWIGLADTPSGGYSENHARTDVADPWPCACNHSIVRADPNDVFAHYNGVCNSSLWPTYHDSIVRSDDTERLWPSHERVTRAFADAVVAHASAGERVWIHDYQLQLLPMILRRRRPDLAIGFFLHIPFPPPEIFMRLPWRAEILDGLRGAHLIGFQTAGCLANFRRVLAMTASAEEPRTDTRQPHLICVPASVDTPRLAGTARSEASSESAVQIRESLGNPRLLILGVDRLDYTKGLTPKVEAVASLLADGSLDASHTVFLQIASPSRSSNVAYVRESRRVSAAFGAAIGMTSTSRHTPIRLIVDSFDPTALIPYFAAADMMLVTPLRDGMNLVAKEFVAVKVTAGAVSRHPSRGAEDARTANARAHPGTLVLSEFAGASRELSQAYLANPYSPASMRRAIMHAAFDPAVEQQRRLQQLGEQVHQHSTFDWAGQFLGALDKAAAREVIELRPRASRVS